MMREDLSDIMDGLKRGFRMMGVKNQSGRHTTPYGDFYAQGLDHQIIIERSNRCEICGKNISHGMQGPSDWGVVHHKDRNPRNNKAENLQALCLSCHTKLHKPKRPRLRNLQKGGLK